MKQDLVVVGGGISGLTLAGRAAREGWRVLLLEARERLGGCIHSHRFSEADGFWLELGAHTIFNSYGHLIERIREAGLAKAARRRRSLSYRLWDPNEGSVSPLRRLHIPELAMGLVRLPFLRRHDRTVSEYYGRVFGARNYQEVIGPALDAVACQPTAHFPADLLFRRKPRRWDMPRSFTFDGGLGSVVEALSGTPGLAVETGREVTALEGGHAGFQVHTTAGAVETRSLALAVPPAVARGLLGAEFPELALAAGSIGSADIETLGVVTSEETPTLPDVAGLIGPQQPFYSLVSRDVIPDPRFRGFAFHFRPGQLDGMAKREWAGRVLGMQPGQFVATVETRSVLPAPGPGHGRIIKALWEARGKLPLGISGNWVDGLSLEDCAARSDAEFERLARLMPR